MWTDNFKSWDKITSKERMKKLCKTPFGAMASDTEIESNIMFINKVKHGTDLKNMENTIVHELIHLKHPSFLESKVKKMADGLVKQ